MSNAATASETNGESTIINLGAVKIVDAAGNVVKTCANLLDVPGKDGWVALDSVTRFAFVWVARDRDWDAIGSF